MRREPAPTIAPAEPERPSRAEAEVPALVKRGREIILALMAELELETTNVHLLAELVEIETAEDSGPHRRRVLEKALSLPVRSQTAKNLAAALATLQDAAPGKKAERQANAEKASEGGRFAVPSAPKLAVDNTR